MNAAISFVLAALMLAGCAQPPKSVCFTGGGKTFCSGAGTTPYGAQWMAEQAEKQAQPETPEHKARMRRYIACVDRVQSEYGVYNLIGQDGQIVQPQTLGETVVLGDANGPWIQQAAEQCLPLLRS